MNFQMGFPTVSVLMPVRNEAGFIARSLSAVLGQDYPHDRMEIVIADGMSTDETLQVIAELARDHEDVGLRVIDNSGQVVATGLNQALQVANGEVIVRIDGHTVIARNYVWECVAQLQRTGADNVGGRMEAVSDGFFGGAVALATSSPFGVGGARFHYSDQEEWVDTVYMGAWPREVFERVGLFDEEQVRNQDDEFNYRLLAHGGKILLSPRIRSKYYNRSTLSSLWRQYFSYGYWKVRVMQKHPGQMRPRQFAPALLVGVLIGAQLLLPFSSLGIYFTLLGAGSYCLANLVGSLLASRRGGWRFFPLLPIAFATLHFSYGLGFLVGLVRFWNRWGKGRNPAAPTLQKIEQL